MRIRLVEKQSKISPPGLSTESGCLAEQLSESYASDKKSFSNRPVEVARVESDNCTIRGIS